MGGLTRRRVRRIILLDSGGLIRLAEGDSYAQEFVEQTSSMYDPPEYRVPDVVLTEVLTGHQHYDAKVNRFLNSIDDPKQPERFWLHMTVEIATRAGLLRAAALAGRHTAKPISAVDAQVVAFAETLAKRVGVSIITSDSDDIEDLLDAINPRPRNIAVEST